MGDQIDQPFVSAPREARDSSPSPSTSPTPAISSCPSPDRTFSSVSSISNFSGDARSSISTSSRRRGYIRPQGAAFADSAKNRESVMCLGSIAHLQYYFARTGLLDGKGGQMARARKKGETEIPKLLLTQQMQMGGDLVESPIDELGDPSDEWDENESVMLPPTVSTYSIRTHYIPPPPDLEALRNDLQSALEKAQKVLTSRHGPVAETVVPTPRDTSPDGLSESDDENSETPTTLKPPQGWYEIEGMHILDLVTLAIRAARMYYTSHENPERLSAIKSERRIREELLGVLDVLKRWASRNFAGGLRDEERAAMLNWISSVGSMLDEERRLEGLEAQKRASWSWAYGEWSSNERAREAAFLQSLETTNHALPLWMSPETGSLPTEFLSRLQDGRDLVRFHNQAVKTSRRHFGEIKFFHEDIGKPYRLAENLRYWIKAAEIRWEIKLDVDVMGVVNGESDEAWKKFDAAIMVWSKGVREELTRDWTDKGPPTVIATNSPESDILAAEAV